MNHTIQHKRFLNSSEFLSQDAASMVVASDTTSSDKLCIFVLLRCLTIILHNITNV